MRGQRKSLSCLRYSTILALAQSHRKEKESAGVQEGQLVRYETANTYVDVYTHEETWVSSSRC